ncbi:MAG: hypothetical protein G01um101456_336 [Parcubacteria group bacterium Gr01-1014_56]|nr:MAG: hypothetical protein G01um101456_336 [Parcubacteria group bacterium Gr01-1014_56]
MNIQSITYWVIGTITAAAVVGGAWFYFSVSGSPLSSSGVPQGDGFGVGDSRTVAVTPSGAGGTQNTIVSTAAKSSQKIFKITDGPVTSATLVQTLHPTTTLARYILQENGHALEVVLDNAGVVARAISNTTIPGTLRGAWTEKGKGILLQYLEESTIKTVYLGFPTVAAATTTSKTSPVRIQFLPNNIIDLSVSPDGSQVAYLLKTNDGSDGYVAKVDGSASKKLFSTPLSQMLVAWPAQKTLLLQTKSAASVLGAAFSVQTASGAVSPLVYALGLSALADRDFAHVVYQTIGSIVSSYAHEVKTNKDRPLSFNPIPEKCVLSSVQSSLLYCAAPLGAVSSSYLDQWHQGVASAPDAIFSFDIKTGRSSILTAPGGEDGGVDSDIAEIAVSPDDRYLIFIKKGDRSLWALRLTQ